jgi:hypothetical protein
LARRKTIGARLAIWIAGSDIIRRVVFRQFFVIYMRTKNQTEPLLSPRYYIQKITISALIHTGFHCLYDCFSRVDLSAILK